MLLNASGGCSVDLPDPTAVLPYLGLFTLVILTPEKVKGHEIATTHLPNLSILSNGNFIPAPDASPTAPNVAHIFDVFATIHDNPPKQRGHIPLSSQDPKFRQQRYWRLTTTIGPVLAMLNEQIGFNNYGCEEIELTQSIRDILSLSRRGLTVSKPLPSRPGGGGSRMNGGGKGLSGGGGEGPSGGRPSGDGRPTGPAAGDLSGRKSGNKRGGTQASGSASKKSRWEAGDAAVSDSSDEGGKSLPN